MDQSLLPFDASAVASAAATFAVHCFYLLIIFSRNGNYSCRLYKTNSMFHMPPTDGKFTF